ncbi:MAG: hypothetical protein NXI01_04120 [Gammaproteobacteria bacterium]|nr:hypothetical protein [Gammaproteobacteria bacterium]
MSDNMQEGLVPGTFIPKSNVILIEHKYSKSEPCIAYTLAILTTIVGGVTCCLTAMIGEAILEKTHTHEKNYTTAINDMARIGIIGRMLTNLALYGLILLYASKLDPARKAAPARGYPSCGMELIFGKDERPPNKSRFICGMILLPTIHAANMLASGSVGYWIYTRNNKSILNFEESIEALAVGIAVTTIPFCLTSLTLATAYSDFRPLPGPDTSIHTRLPTRIPDYIGPPKTEKHYLEETAKNTAAIAEELRRQRQGGGGYR